MGCVGSRPDVTEISATVFQVESYDDNGLRHRTVSLEVTDNDLVLHNKNKAAVRWPLRCLRRYGFDGETFTFEAGRRCPTGPGIYTYRCRRAQDLFNTLQLHIQKIAEQSTSVEAPIFASDNYLHPIGGTRPRLESLQVPNTNQSNAVLPPPIVQQLSHSSTGSVNSPVTSPHVPVSPTNDTVYINNTVLAHENLNEIERGTSAPPPTPAAPEASVDLNSVFINYNEKPVSFYNYCDQSQNNSNLESTSSISPINIERQPSFPTGYDPFINHDSTDLSDSNTPSIVRTPDIPDISYHVYINIGNENRKNVDRVYENISGFQKGIPIVPPRYSLTAGSAGSGSSNSGTTATDTPQQDPQINYITVDVDTRPFSSHVPPVSPEIGSTNFSHTITPATGAVGEGYAKIDFDRTEALINTAKMANSHANGGRHNSTFSGIIHLPQQNSPYS